MTLASERLSKPFGPTLGPNVVHVMLPAIPGGGHYNPTSLTEGKAEAQGDTCLLYNMSTYSSA